LNKSPDHTYSFNITGAVKEWKAGNTSASKDKGVVFKASNAVEADTSVDNYKTFGSYNRASNQPSLTVEYYGVAADLLGVYASDVETYSCLTHIKSSLEDCGYETVRKRTGSFTRDAVLGWMDAGGTSVFLSNGHGSRSPTDESVEQIGTCIFLNESYWYEQISSDEFPAEMDLSNLKLAVFVGCQTGLGGEGGPNLPTVVVEHGAETAIGFSDSIYSDGAFEWTRLFFQKLVDGKTVGEACEELNRNEDNVEGVYEVVTCAVVCGNKNNRFF
jgi:hypothetical protein